jgi:hypothetical protein
VPIHPPLQPYQREREREREREQKKTEPKEKKSLLCNQGGHFSGFKIKKEYSSTITSSYSIISTFLHLRFLEQLI